MATLYQIGGDGSPAEKWDIAEQPLVVGRSGHAQARLQDDGLSRRHFLIEPRGDHYVIKDLNSRNGTWLGGQRISAKKLHDNDLILAGHTRFRFIAPPRLAPAVGRALTGPHGTVVASAMVEAKATAGGGNSGGR